MVRRSLSIAGFLLMVLQLGLAQPLTLGEQYVTRGYGGKALGQAMAHVLKWNSVRIITNNSTICAALTGSIASSYLDSAGQRRLEAIVFATPEEVKALNPKEDAVALILGGQTPAEVNYGIAKGVLKALAEGNYQGALFLHLPVWRQKFLERGAQEDPAIARYLEGKRDIFAVEYDAQANVLSVWRVQFREGRQVLVRQVFWRTPNPTWENLLKRLFSGAH